MRHRNLLLPMSGNMELQENPTRQFLDTSSMGSSSSSKEKESIHGIPVYVAFAIIALLCMLYGGVYLLDKSLPSPYKLSDEAEYPDEFIAERAQTILKGLTDIGPRVVGSKENEIEAVNYLNGVIDEIIKDAHKSFVFEKDLQVSSGAYYLGFVPTGLISSYGNVQNIIVKLEGKVHDDTILINSHFDTVPTSPGGSDDGIMVAVMLETMRKLTQTERVFERDIIFLFNGAEEPPLQAAHGFITQHKWAKACKTIINLEAAGHGGRAILFQSGPKRSSSLLSHYNSVPYPFGQAAGEEVFQSNILPSDTDFRLFRDFGDLSGYDIAFAQNGYRYHTKYDNYKDLPLWSYQHAGSNLLALVKSIAEDPNTIEDGDDKVVYFDIFNWFMISYSVLAAYIINIIVSLVSLVVGVWSLKNLEIRLNKSSILYLFYVVSTILGSWVVGAGFAVLIGVFLDATNCTMSWFAQPIIIFGLYVAPIIACFTSIMWIFNYFGPHAGKSLGAQSQIQMHIIRLIWSFVLFVGTLIKIRSVYVIMLPVLFNTLGSIVILLARWQQSARKWQICAFIFTLIPVIIIMYLGVEIFSLFIPISGRNGAKTNPELLLSLITVFIVLLISSYYISFSVLVRRQYVIPIILFLGFLVTMIVILSNGAFPYSGDEKTPTPQRFTIFHTNRVHHDENGDIIEQSGIFMVNNDRNSPNSVKSYVDLHDAQNISLDCEKYPACGMPITSSRMVSYVETSTWKPFSKAVINEQISMKHTTTLLNPKVKRYEFTIEGPDHLNVFIRPRAGTKILTNNLHDMSTDADELLFIAHTYGKIKTSLTFTVDAQAENVNAPLMDFVVSGKYYNLNGQEQMTKEYEDFLKKFPDWADVAAALANYESYVI